MPKKKNRLQKNLLRLRKNSKGFLRLNKKLKLTDPRALLVLGLVLVVGVTAVVASQAATGGSFTIGDSSDTYVDSANPSTNYGQATRLRISLLNNRSLLRFHTENHVPSGYTITGAKLKLYIATNRLSSGAIEVHPETGSWLASSVTWNTQPTWNATVLATSATPVAGTWVTINLPAKAISATTTTNFGLRYNAANAGVTFASREDAAHAPQLTVNYSSSSTVTPTPTPTPTPVPTGTLVPTPTPTPTKTPTPTPTSTPVTTSWNCSGKSECDYPADPAHFIGMNINKWNDPLGNNISKNVWSPVSGETVTLSANSAQNYRITANANNPSGSVTAYPNAAPAHGAGLGSDYTGIVDDYTSLTETISQTMPINSKTSAWAMDDDWFSDPGHPEDNYDYELMIQYDFTNNGDCSATANNININGTLWHVCIDQDPRPNGVCNDCGYIAFKLGATEADKPSLPSTSMTIDIKAIVTWLETHKVPGQTYNYMNPGVSVSALSNGWEIADTGGTTQNFYGNGYTVKATGGCAAGIRADCNLK